MSAPTPISVPLTATTARVAVLIASDATCLEPAAALARELGLPLIDTPYPEFDLLLAWTGRRLELRDNRDPRVGAVFADFAALARQRRLSARDPLVRAIGKPTRSVVDATLGLGADAWMLARYGYEVLGIERQPVVAALVRDALERFQYTSPHPDPLPEGEGIYGNPPKGKGAGGTTRPSLRLINGVAQQLLPTLDPAPDVIYLDPMFPPKRRRSAAPSKEMRLLRLLAGEDADAHELFEVARRVARQRVVVKRPDHAAPLAPNPTMSYGGKLVRYDVYRVEAKRPE